MRAVLREVAPPTGLADRVRLAARFEHRAERRRRWWYAAAASVLLIVSVGLLSPMQTVHEGGGLTLAQSVLNHIEDESDHLRATGSVSSGRLKWVFGRFGATLVRDLGQVNFAAECAMRVRNGVHLVLPGRVGPITVFFMPGERTDGPLPVRSERFDGSIVPTAWGSIAVVGELGEAVHGLGQRLSAAVDWPMSANAPTTSDLVDPIRVVRRILAAQQQDG